MPGITFFSVVPIRKEPMETSEMVSQLLFGETFEIIEKSDKWTNITTHWDNYTGWIDSKMFTEITSEEHQKLLKSPFIVTRQVSTQIFNEPTGYSQNIPAGSILYNFDKGKNRSFILSHVFMTGKINGLDQNATFADLTKQFLNAPYLWGGRTCFGIDCSGFTQLIYKMKLMPLPRDSKDQAKMGTDVNMLHEVQPGDLAFFDNDEGNIIHVGILLDPQTIIHASGCVKIDKFDQQGIYDVKNKSYSHHLRMIKRIN